MKTLGTTPTNITKLRHIKRKQLFKGVSSEENRGHEIPRDGYKAWKLRRWDWLPIVLGKVAKRTGREKKLQVPQPCSGFLLIPDNCLGISD